MIDLASVASLLAWWAGIALCGLLAWPLTARLLPAESDLGYLAAKPIGWLIGALLAYLAAVLGVPFAQFGWAVGLAGLVALFIATARRRPDWPALPRILMWETAFLLALIGGTLIRAKAPDIQGLEKFMDFAFVNGALRAQSMPPPDPWFAGAPINYYYFGHTAAAWLIQVSRVPADHGFNLMMGTIFAFVATLSFRIVSGVLETGSRRLANMCGFLAALLVTVGGNFHSVLYGPLRAFSPTSYDRDFFYPDSTRFVGFDPPTMDKGFTEMPGYGFAVGDLHAHVLNLPTAFLLILIFTRILLREWATPTREGVRPLEAAMLAMLFGISAMCNSWDAVSYGLLMLLVGLLLLVRRPGKLLPRFGRLTVTALAVMAGAGAIAAPFLLGFKPIASHFMLSDGQTPLWQLLVLYTHILIPALILFGGLALSPLRRNPAWVVAATLALLALLLIALPEIAYVKDIYGFDHRRANTMFKFTFQAQPIGVMAGFILVGLLLANRRLWVALVGLLVSLPLLLPLSYAGEFYGDPLRKMGQWTFSLDGTGFITNNWPDDGPLLDWLQQQDPATPMLMVEAAGDSFTNSSRLSAMTGVPIVLGWRGHEWLWRGQPSDAYGLSDRIAAFYRAPDLAAACDFVRTHGVTHVVIGGLEHELYPDLNRAVLDQLGQTVVSRGNSAIIAIKSDSCPG